MAPLHYSYLFDAELFRQRMLPLISELEMGNYARLRELAHRAVQEKPETRILLDTLYLGYVYAYYEEPGEDHSEPRPEDCLVALLTPFLHPLPEGAEWGQNGWGGFVLLKQALELIGWTEYDIRLPLFGKSLCELLNPSGVSDLLDGRWGRGLDTDPWCASGLGWLDLSSVEMLEQKLLHSKHALLELAQQPKLFASPHINQQFLTEGLPIVYAHLEQVLLTAKIERKELIVTVAS